MSIRRILPLEVQSLILSYLVKPRASPAVPSLTRRAVPSSRFSSTASFSSRDIFPSSSAVPDSPTSSAAPTSEGTTLSVFEDRSDEYDHVPLSTLDHSPAPRSPADLLQSLLSSNKHAEALELLHELQASGQTITPRMFFARFAKAALLDRADPAWLEWWKLAPSLVGNVDVNATDVRMDNVLMRRYARRMSQHLLKKGEAEGIDWDQLVEFAYVLARQGQAKVVADSILPDLAAYGPPDLSERVFRTTLDELRRQRVEFVVRTNLSRRSSRYRRRRAQHDLPLPPTNALAWSRSIALRAWFQHQTQDNFEALLAARRQQLLHLANLGHLDAAVQLVLETQTLPSLTRSKTIRLGRVLYIKLLSLVAIRNRYDLFEPLYESLQLSGRRLVRISNHRLRVRTPFIIRGTDFDPHGADSPSARDAFIAYRYRQVVSSIEEGPAVVESDDLSEDGLVPNRPPHERHVARLLKSIEMNRPDRAIEYMVRFFLNDSLPSARVAATWIAYAKDAGTNCGPRLAKAFSAVQELADSTLQRRGYWATATMLSHLLAGQPEAALLAYKSHYALVGLPQAVRDAVPLVVQTAPRSVRETRTARGFEGDLGRRFPPSAYTFSVLVQAIVASLERLATAIPVSPTEGDRGRSSFADRIDAVYQSLVSTPAKDLNILPRLHDVDISSNGETFAWIGHESSPLSPYTFTPFLLHLARQKAAPFALLSVLADMSSLGLQPQLPHYALVLNSFARHGDSSSPQPSSSSSSASSADLLFLLDCFSHRKTDSLFASSASPSVVELITSGGVSLPPPGPAGDLNAKVYTGVLSGLLKRKERDLALRVLNELAEHRGEEVKRWGREDEKFREVVVKVMNRDRREEQQ